MSTVYIVNETLRRDPDTGKMDRAMDLTPAKAFGELVHILPPGSLPNNIEYVIETIHKSLRNITSDDFLLLVGNPIAIGIACAVASDKTDGKFGMLRWNPKVREYEPVMVDIFPEEGVDF